MNVNAIYNNHYHIIVNKSIIKCKSIKNHCIHSSCRTTIFEIQFNIPLFVIILTIHIMVFIENSQSQPKAELQRRFTRIKIHKEH